MAHGGAAMGRDQDGRMVFVQGGLPGEDVHARVIEARKRYAHAALARLPRDPSPHRVDEAPCPHFGSWPERGLQPELSCGGCHWQHIEYGAQLQYKHDVLVDALTRIAGISNPVVHAAIGMPSPWRYRNKLTLRATGSELAFTALDGRTLLGIDECLIAHPRVTELMNALDPRMPEGAEVVVRAGTRTGDRMVVLSSLGDDVGEIEVAVDASVVVIADDGTLHLASGRPRLTERLGGRLFDVPAPSFFQVNTEMAERLLSVVSDALPASSRTLVDVYSGVGVFAISLAHRAKEVYAIEADALAVAAAADNAEGLENLTLLEADAAEGLAYLKQDPDAVIVDPPRTGVDRETRQLLATLAPHTMIYVSCEPSTLARDARQLVEAGYQLRWSRPLDMFPQTYHVESVNLFTR
jgi:23S rRNA (uracil1939-C5)-methyltransferase